MEANQTVRVAIRIPDESLGMLMAEMSDHGFHGFEEQHGGLIGYIQEPLWNAEVRGHLVDWLTERLTEVAIVEDVVQHQNWNAIWEASIEPVEAGGFVVLPSWQVRKDNSSTLKEIRIDPKMSFGTGHHETTRLMLELMSTIPFEDTHVLDAGTGTAVLAIGARMLGAKSVVGFDIDPWSVTNAKENLDLNSMQGVDIFTGSIQDLKRHGAEHCKFDVIVANIIQVVIEEFIPYFARLISPEGDLIVSGILNEGEDELTRQANESGFDVLNRMAENEWVGVHFRARSK